MKLALVQMTSTQDPQENLAECEGFVREAASRGAEFVLTPEVTNCIAASRKRLADVLFEEADDPFLKRMRAVAAECSVWLLLGSLGVKSESVEGKFANRSFLIAPDGEIIARYDKIHMFDVEISDTEKYRESNSYERGDKAVVAQTPFAKIGLTICYDVRFPHLYRTLAQNGAEIITVPAAFAQTTGEAHWHTLLRARAIETGAFIIAPAQTGLHYSENGKDRRTFGHSMVVAPWGEIILDAGTEKGVFLTDIDLSEVTKARRRIGSLTQLSEFEAPS